MHTKNRKIDKILEYKDLIRMKHNYKQVGYGIDERAMIKPGIDFIKKKTGFKISACFTSRNSIEAVLRQYKKSLQAEFGDIINKNAECRAADSITSTAR